MKKDFEKYVLECLEKYCKFNEELCSVNFEDFIVNPLLEAKCFENGFYSENGVSKGVLIFDDQDYVIKIPFYCEGIEPDGEYDTELDTYIQAESFANDYPFQGTQVEGYSKLNDWDYCETEVLVYDAAIKNNVDFAFAKTEFIGWIGFGGYPIYKQVKVEERSSYRARVNRTLSDEEFKTAQTFNERTKIYLDEMWVADFIAAYGEEKLNDLARFLDDYFVEDLHPNNIGYTFSGKPCIFDYSSYDC